MKPNGKGREHNKNESKYKLRVIRGREGGRKGGFKGKTRFISISSKTISNRAIDTWQGIDT